MIPVLFADLPTIAAGPSPAACFAALLVVSISATLAVAVFLRHLADAARRDDERYYNLQSQIDAVETSRHDDIELYLRSADRRHLADVKRVVAEHADRLDAIERRADGVVAYGDVDERVARHTCE